MCFREEPSRGAWLDATVRGADWWRATCRPTGVALGLRRSTIPTTEQDAAATAIAAAALLKLARVGLEERRVRYREFAEVTIEAPPPGTSRWTASTPVPAWTSAGACRFSA